MKRALLMMVIFGSLISCPISCTSILWTQDYIHLADSLFHYIHNNILDNLKYSKKCLDLDRYEFDGEGGWKEYFETLVNRVTPEAIAEYEKVTLYSCALFILNRFTGTRKQRGMMCMLRTCQLEDVY